MMMKRILLTILVLVQLPVVAVLPALADSPTPRVPTQTNDSVALDQGQRAWFDRLTAADGLSDDAVNAILQDRQGFMWFGTANGLTRYNGYDFTIYRHDPGDSTTLSHDNVYTIYEDREGSLWIGSSGGLDRLDPATGAFTHYLSGRAVTALHEEEPGVFWVGTTFGLTLLDPAAPAPSYFIRGTFTDVGDPAKLSGSVVRVIYEDQEDELWVGSGGGTYASKGGLDRLERATDTYVHYRNDPDSPTSLSGGSVLALFEDAQGHLWVGTEAGLNRMDRAAGTFARYRHDPSDPYSLANDQVRAILQDGKGRLWIGTQAGLEQLLEDEAGRAPAGQDEEKSRFLHYRHDPSDPRSLGSDWINTIYEDRSGVLWVGTEAGISKYNETASHFAHYRHLPGEAGSLSDGAVLAVFEDELGTLWVGTIEGGLNRLDRSSGEVIVYRHDPEDPTSLSSDAVTVIYEDRSGTLWVGTGDRWLHQFDRETETFTPVEYLSAGAPVAIVEHPNGDLWVGTPYGLYRLDPRTGDRAYFSGTGPPANLSGLGVNALAIGQDGMVFVGTDGGGISVWDPALEGFSQTTHRTGVDASLSHGSVLALYADPDGSGGWVGTWAGLDRYDSASHTFTHYGEQHGLPGGPVVAVLVDGAGYVWLATHWGLSRFDPRTETCRNYDARDGLQPGRFYNIAAFQSDSGEMFFGGSNGLNAFYPDQIPSNPYPPPVTITALLLFNDIIQSDLPPDESIELTHRENFLSFEFAALDYTAPDKNEYAWRMEGVDPDWVLAGTRRRADYPNLSPGNYVFRVKGSNNDGVWNEEGAAISISIQPPFWQEWWFRSIAGLAVLGIAFAAYQMRVRGLRKRGRELEALVDERTGELSRTNQRLLEEMAERERAEGALAQQREEAAVLAERNRLAQDLHDSVTQSMYGVTLYAEVASQLLSSGQPDQALGHLDELKGLALDALGEMRLLIFELRPPVLEEEGLVSALQFRLDAVEGRVGLETQLQVEGEIRLDPHAEGELYRIAQEALNNILKHARAHQVTLSLYRVPEQSTVVLEISDDGVGFDLAEGRRSGGMGLRGMEVRAEQLGGTLTVDSRPGTGTTVRVEVPQ